jgi:hypothetical protein
MPTFQWLPLNGSLAMTTWDHHVAMSSVNSAVTPWQLLPLNDDLAVTHWLLLTGDGCFSMTT